MKCINKKCDKEAKHRATVNFASVYVCDTCLEAMCILDQLHQTDLVAIPIHDIEDED